MAKLRYNMMSTDEAKVCKGQHRAPCSDCPFRRGALQGWLGGVLSAEKYVMQAHFDVEVTCHCKKKSRGEFWQCAGAAIYRSNVLKRVIKPGILVLPPNHEKVFSTPMEFISYHSYIGLGNA